MPTDKNTRNIPEKMPGCVVLMVLALRLFVYLIALLMTLAVTHLLTDSLWTMLSGVSGNEPVLESLVRLAVLPPLFGVAYLLVRYGEGLPFSDLGFSLHREWGREWLKGLAVAFLCYLVGFGALYVLGEVEVSSCRFYPQSLISSWMLMLSVSLTEELIFRSVLLGRLLNAGINRTAALLLSALVFSLLHLFNDGFSAIAFVNIWLAGVLLGIPYIYTRNIWYAVSLHLFWNWLQGPVLGFGVSGNKVADTLLTLHLPGNGLLTGGEFGFEASVICTLLLLSAITLTWLRASRRFASVRDPRSTLSRARVDAQTLSR